MEERIVDVPQADFLRDKSKAFDELVSKDERICSTLIEILEASQGMRVGSWWGEIKIRLDRVLTLLSERRELIEIFFSLGGN